MPKTDILPADVARAVSRHTLSYLLCAISELFHHYDFDPLDLLIIHAVLNANVREIMRDRNLNLRFAGIAAVEPTEAKQSVSRSALARFLNLPLETVRRRAARLKKTGVLAEWKGGLVVVENNPFQFGNNPHLQKKNVVLLRKLLRDLNRLGVNGANDL